MRKPEFTVEISRPGESGALTSASLELPATQAEYDDCFIVDFGPELGTCTVSADHMNHYNTELYHTGRVRVARPVNGISLNGNELLMDDDGKVIQFQETADGGMEFRVWGLSVDIQKAPFAAGDSASDRFVAGCAIELEVPVSFGGRLLPPMQITVKTSAGYTPKF